MTSDMADDIRAAQIIQGYSLSEALGLGVYGGFAHSVVTGLVSSETAFVGAATALSRLHRLAMRPDGEVALMRPARENATREGIGRMLLRAAYTAAYGQFGWKAEAAPKRSAAQMRSCPDAGRLLHLDGASATLAECACLAEAVIGAKRREALVKAYGEGTVRKAVGSPADPVTAAAVGAVMRDIQALMGERERRLAEIDRLETLEMREVREKWHAERKRAIEECNAADAELNRRIAELRGEAGDGEGEA